MIHNPRIQSIRRDMHMTDTRLNVPSVLARRKVELLHERLLGVLGEDVAALVAEKAEL